MLIGFDASRAFSKERTGTENYSFNLLKGLKTVDQINKYRLYVQGNTAEPSFLTENFHFKTIKMPRLWTQLGLAFECLKSPPDILFIPAHTLPVFKSPFLKTVVTIHDLGAEYLKQYHQFPQRLYLNRSTEFATRFATHLVAVSRATKKDLMKRFKVKEERITVVYEAYDRDLFFPIEDRNLIQEVKNRWKIKGDYILFVGTIQPRKNLVNLIKAYARVKKKREVKFVLVGKKGWLSEEIYKTPKRLGLMDDVYFLDYVPSEDLPTLYSGASVFVLPSLFEGFGIPILEAMACGCPVVTSSISSMCEVGGEAVLLVDPYNIEEIASAIEKVLTDTKLQRDLREKGFKQVKKFSWEKSAQETLSVFERIYGKS